MTMSGIVLGEAMYLASGVDSDVNLSSAEKLSIRNHYITVFGTPQVQHIQNNAEVSTVVAPGIVVTTPDTINGTTTSSGSGAGGVL